MDSRPEGDRVVILEDTDGDSIADRDKTFYQSKELTNPLGICVLPQATGTKVIVSAAPTAKTKDTDYVFITFVINYLPIGMVGLLLAVIFMAAMSSTASEINALATTTVIDLYQRSIVTQRSDQHYLNASRWFTLVWGAIALGFATSADLFIDTALRFFDDPDPSVGDPWDKGERLAQRVAAQRTLLVGEMRTNWRRINISW
jgi:Na+(H+)/acetate symporter ActP